MTVLDFLQGLEFGGHHKRNYPVFVRSGDGTLHAVHGIRVGYRDGRPCAKIMTAPWTLGEFVAALESFTGAKGEREAKEQGFSEKEISDLLNSTLVFDGANTPVLGWSYYTDEKQVNLYVDNTDPIQAHKDKEMARMRGTFRELEHIE